MTVNVITPNGVIYSHHANMVVAKTLEGEVGIMNHHEPIIIPLCTDEVRVKRVDDDKHVDWIAVSGGVLEVRDNIVSIITDRAERDRDIDLPRAERAKLLSEQRIEEAKKAHDADELARGQVALTRAINRINVSKHL